MLPVLILLMQAALPPSGLHYYALTEFDGPGLVCGAAFSIHLLDGETAMLKKRSAIDAEVVFNTRDGRFTIHESQYATEGGKPIRKVADGVIKRKRDNGMYVWTYTNAAPGSTDVFGPGVNARAPSSAFDRIRFGSVRYGIVGSEKCLHGRSSDRKPT